MLKFREIHVYYVRDDGRYYVKSREPGRILELDEWPNGDWVSETHEVEYELIEETT